MSTSCHALLEEEGRSSRSFPCASCKKECLVELLATYLLVFLGPASVIVTSSALGVGLSPTESITIIGASFAVTVGGSIILFGKISTPQMNPVITLSAWLTAKLRKELVIPLTLFQLSGALVAGLTLRTIFNITDRSELGSTILAPGISPLYGVILETLGTCALTLVALLASSRFQDKRKLALTVAFTLFLLILILGPLTGASLNPVRSLGPALASGYLKDLSVFIIGPYMGGALAAAIYYGLTKKR